MPPIAGGCTVLPFPNSQVVIGRCQALLVQMERGVYNTQLWTNGASLILTESNTLPPSFPL